MKTIEIKNLIDVKLTELIGMNVNGIPAQVTNPIYISKDCPPAYRVLRKIKKFKERGKWWVELFWERQPGDSCDFTGCTIESNSCTIQMDADDFEKLKESKPKKSSARAYAGNIDRSHNSPMQDWAETSDDL